VPIACPYCDHRINLKAGKPGRFRPKCPACTKPFLLVIPELAGAGVQVRSLPSDTVASPAAARKSLRPALVLEETPPPEGQSSVIAIAEPSSHGSGRSVSEDTNPGGGAVAAPQRAGKTPVKASGDERSFLEAQLRGYEIERELGRGGMGSVYLARQLSLDRPVALKVMSKRWANDPVFVARFTREAYAAAQLSHPNIVHIHDIGEVEGTRFFSMEYVPGQSLADLVRRQGKLDPETAVGYVLQAARGLKHAHDRGMIHRDVKPDNLLIDEQGLVKVADLGLVKTPGTQRADDQLSGNPRGGLGGLPSDMTGARIALGTPAYMSPEQCRDAAAVDHRADVYSLGCTLYVLVTGRPPFQGTTDVELMTKHVYDPIVPPEQIVARVPKEVSAIIQRMMAKQPEDRFQNMGEVVRTLEAWLGVHHGATFSPQEEQISRLEGYTQEFNTSPSMLLRGRVIIGFYYALTLASVLLLFFGKLNWAFGVAGLAAQTAAAYFVLHGVTRRGHFFTRVRQFVVGLSVGDWAVVLASFTLFCLLLTVLKVFWICLGFGLVGVGLAFVLRFGLDRRVDAERRTPLESCERLMKRLRVQGLDEEELRLFVAKFAGRNWEEVFEQLFGFEAKMTARTVLLRGGVAGDREKHAGWREPLIAAMDRIEKSRRVARELELLQSVERAQLLAAGATPEAAENQARGVAEAMVQAAGQVREAEVERVRIGTPRQEPAAPLNVRAALQESRDHPLIFGPTKPGLTGRFMGFLIGPHVRAALASVLLAGCALWAYQNTLISGADLQAEATRAIDSRDLSSLQQTASRDLNKPTRPLELTGVPSFATAWLDGWNAGFAGLLLFGSLLARGNLTAAFALLGAAVAAGGHHLGIRTVEPLRAEHMSMLLGSGLLLIGFRVGR
jgi:serine/threonine protein kinase